LPEIIFDNECSGIVAVKFNALNGIVNGHPGLSHNKNLCCR